MTHNPQRPRGAGFDAVGVIAPHLAAPEEPIRCAAARALGALGDQRAAPALIGALTDTDPDVRSDAMTALVRCARPGDAAAIRRSLTDDPVAEVKIAAIRALCRLEDGASTDVLRALSNDRCEPRIAWERPHEGWDDWLDVQVAAIAALGDIHVEDAVGDLIRARNDETGQGLDHAVFGALAKMSARGIGTLIDFLADDDPRVRRRALAAFLRTEHRLPAPVRDALVRDSDPEVRVLAIEGVGEGDAVLSRCALNDPSAFVRRAAIARIAPSRPEVGRLSLDDPDERVRTVALEAIAASVASSCNRGGQPSPRGVSDIATKAQDWLRTAGPHLAASCASVLPKLAGRNALHPLREAAGDPQMSLEVRIAALRAIGAIGSGGAVDALRAAAADPVRQVRLAALATMGELARMASGDVRRRARQTLIDAVRNGPRSAGDPAATKGTGAPRSLRDAKIERSPAERATAPSEEESDPGDPSEPRTRGVTGPGAGAGGPSYPRSTLEAIRPPSPAAIGEAHAVTPAHDSAQWSRHDGLVRPRRVPVEGCDDIVADIRLAAIRIVAECPGDGVEGALGEAAETGNPGERVAALEAIARRAASRSLSPELVATLVRFLRHDDSPVRVAAARAIAASANGAHRTLAPLIADSDPGVRAVAIAAVAEARPELVEAGFGDASPLVRRTAVDAAATHGHAAVLQEGLRIVVNGGWSDTLIDACRRCPDASRLVLPMLDAPDCPRRVILMILDALGHAGEGRSGHSRGVCEHRELAPELHPIQEENSGRQGFDGTAWRPGAAP